MHIYPEKDTIEVEPTEKHTHCETSGKFLGYRYPIKEDAQVWKNQCETKMDARHRDENNIMAPTPWSSYYTMTCQGTEKRLRYERSDTSNLRKQRLAEPESLWEGI